MKVGLGRRGEGLAVGTEMRKKGSPRKDGPSCFSEKMQNAKLGATEKKAGQDLDPEDFDRGSS